MTRFPPEPNGYLHVGHAKSICLNFGLAADFGGTCNLRFDDTNPETENVEYVEAIKEDVRWLGFDWEDRLFHASDYFERLAELAEHLIRWGYAYVDSLSEEEIRLGRGTVTEPGHESPYRNRSIEENLDLFRRMRRGEFEDGTHVLRARGDMASPNMKMRDPLLYRIRHVHHYRSGDTWCIYPMYDFAHPLSDAIEGVTHSLCTLEFENNRELYDWVVDHCVEGHRPYQYEFARLNLDYTIMSKRKLLRLVGEGHVAGWDDPRMPTIAGFRRRGVTPEAVRTFCETIGVARADSRVGIDLLEYTIRHDLNARAPRVMCVLRPLKVTIVNFPVGHVEEIDAPYWPHDIPREGTRTVPFGRELYIDRKDFRESPPKGYYRLAPGREVRLRYAYLIRCEEIVRDPTGEIVELRCTYDPDSRGGRAPDGRRVRGTVHWVADAGARPVEVRLYDRLFRVPDPEAGGDDWTAYLHPDSLATVRDALIEPSVPDDPPGQRYQFEREGYFWTDPVDSRPGRLVFNRIVALRDTWSKIEAGLPPETPKAHPDRVPAKDSGPIEKGPPPKTPKVPDRIQAFSLSEEARLAGLLALGVSHGDAMTLTKNPALGEFFDEALKTWEVPKSVAKGIVNELLRVVKATNPAAFPVPPDRFARFVRLIDEGVFSRHLSRDVLDAMIETDREATAVVEGRGWRQVGDPGAIEPVVKEVLAAFPEKIEVYRSGKKGLIGFFMGEVMKRTGGQAKPILVRELLERRLAP